MSGLFSTPQISIPVSTAPLTDLDRVTLEWLQNVLVSAGCTWGETISGLSLQTQRGNWSANVRLKLEYQNRDSIVGPETLFLKMAGGPESTFGDSEVRYYTEIGTRVPNAPLPRCYSAAYAAESGYYHLLLEDLSASHTPSWEKQWHEDDTKSLAEAFAQLHAAWWDNPDITSVVAPLPNEAILARYLLPAQNGLEPLLEGAKEQLPVRQLDIIRRVFEWHPHLMRERAKGRHFTCIHGDPNPGNILSPHTPGGRCYLIDRQPFDWSLQTWIGASDLAYALVHWWPSEQRAMLEVPLLRHYHAALLHFGVSDYSWDELWYDYRLAAMQSFYVVGEWCSEPEQMARMEWVWRPQLAKTLQAFADLKCEELLG